MLVLGINYLSHDAAAAIVKDGELLFAAEQERFSKEKHTRDFPSDAVRECLKFAKASISDVDAVCLPYLFNKQIQTRFLGYWFSQYPLANERMLYELDTVKKSLALESELRERLNFSKELYFCRHHVAHMASAYYLSGFDRGALFTVDGLGEMESTLTGEAEGNEIRIFEEDNTHWPNSLGSLYAAATRYLGFAAHCDEGKVMGLAPYGNPAIHRSIFEEMITLQENGKFAFNLEFLRYPFRQHSHFSEKFLERCGPPREPNTQITERHKDIAAAVQEATERVMLHVAQNLYERTHNKNLCLAGGVALNCVANGRILQETSFERIYVQPAANDAGTAAGAALHYYYAQNPNAPRRNLAHAYLGTGYSDEEMEKVLRKKYLSFERTRDACAKAASLLAKGKIIGWFNGRMEFGPRSLGNRSIITAPFPAEMKDILNAKVKKRESFRPFAPTVGEEDCGKYFDQTHESPFMLLTYKVKEECMQQVPAITHVDGTARVQTVTAEQNPDFYRLIGEFKKRTGIGVLLNTSFNIMGQPIVESPEEAIDCFLSTGIDCLVLNAKYIVIKNDRNHVITG